MKAAGVDPLAQFLANGEAAGRQPIAPGVLLVAAAGINPLEHYQFGAHEGRDPSLSFDSKAYLAADPDVAAAHVDLLVHFLEHGLAEGRHAFADGAWG